MTCKTCGDRRTVTYIADTCQPERQGPCPSCVGVGGQMVSVPVNPTSAMMSAAWKVIPPGAGVKAIEVWRVMLAASPKPTTVEASGMVGLTQPKCDLIAACVRWAFHSIGEGFVVPEDDFCAYTAATGDADWEGLPDRIAASLPASWQRSEG